jgi:hypothetical protein
MERAHAPKLFRSICTKDFAKLKLTNIYQVSNQLPGIRVAAAGLSSISIRAERAQPTEEDSRFVVACQKFAMKGTFNG